MITGSKLEMEFVGSVTARVSPTMNFGDGNEEVEYTYTLSRTTFTP